MLTEAEVIRECLPSKGFLREYVRYAVQRTDGHAIFHVGAGLTALQLTLGPEQNLPRGTRSSPLLYTLLVGASGEARKTEAVNLIEQVIREWDQTKICEQPASPEGFLDLLREKSDRMLLYPEFGSFLDSVGRVGGYAEPLKTAFMAAYDGMPVGGRTLGSRKAGHGVVKNPRVTMLCACAQTLLDRSQESDWTGGFFGRFLIFLADRVREFKPQPKPDPDWRGRLASMLGRCLYDAWCGGHLQLCGDLTPEAMKVYVEWIDRVEALKKTAPIPAVLARVGKLAEKIAYLIAWDIGEGARGQPWAIDEESVRCACRIMDAHVASLIEISRGLAPSLDMQHMRAVLRAINGHPTPYGEILAKSQLLKRRADECLATLVSRGDVERVTDPASQTSGEAFYLRLDR